MALTMPGERPSFKRSSRLLMRHSHGLWQHLPMRRGALLLLLGLLLLAGCGGGSHKARQSDPPKTGTSADPVRRVATVKRLVPVAAGNLASAVQDAAAAPYSGGAVLLGGLTAADVSTDQIVTATRAGSQRVGHIPTAVHDSAAVKIGRAAYLFGGGTATTQLDTIVMVDPATGAAQAVGHLPTGSSDQSAALIGRTAYIVGGYTGSTRWLDTIVAWSPGGPAHVVAHLPHTLRYAAVTAAAGRVVIAGGSLENGTASDAVYAFLPATRKVVRIGRLPAPTTHAAAAAIGTTAFVIGGRGASAGTPTDRIVAVDPVKRTVRVVGSLGRPLSDLAAVSDPRGILLAGGRDASGTVSSLTELVPSTHAARVTQAVVGTSTRQTGSETSARGAHARPYVYVPNSTSGTVDVIDQRTFKVVEHFAVGSLPQHVVPAWDLKTLYVTNDLGNTLTPINPNTGKPGTHDPGRRSVQHVLHARWALRDRRRRALAPARLPRSAHLQAPPLAVRPVLRRGPHGLLCRRQLRDREL